MKFFLSALLAVSFSTFAYANDYTIQGRNVYFKGKKIGEISSAFGGWKGYCERRKTGKVRVYSQKQDAVSSIVRECKT